MFWTSREGICGSVQSSLTRPRFLKLRSRSPSYGRELSACLSGPIKTIPKNCKVCHTSCWHAAAEKRYLPTSNRDCFLFRTGRQSFPVSARAGRESQAVPVALAHLECQGADVFFEVIEF